MPETQNCGNCGVTLRKEASFCKSCGAPVRSVNDMKCPTCGNDNPAGAQFCGGCGTNLISGEASIYAELPMVGFGEAISRGFTNYFTFSGRASRPEYWWWVLFTALVAIIPVSILVTFIPSLALASRRLHDIGKSGWWQLLPLGGLILVFLILFSAGAYFESLWPMSLMELLVSLVLFPASIVLLIVWLAKKGDEGPNKYGPDPIQPTQ